MSRIREDIEAAREHDRKDAAATRIQAAFKGFQTRAGRRTDFTEVPDLMAAHGATHVRNTPLRRVVEASSADPGSMSDPRVFPEPPSPGERPPPSPFATAKAHQSSSRRSPFISTTPADAHPYTRPSLARLDRETRYSPPEAKLGLELDVGAPMTAATRWRDLNPGTAYTNPHGAGESEDLVYGALPRESFRGAWLPDYQPKAGGGAKAQPSGRFFGADQYPAFMLAAKKRVAAGAPRAAAGGGGGGAAGGGGGGVGRSGGASARPSARAPRGAGGRRVSASAASVARAAVAGATAGGTGRARRSGIPTARRAAADARPRARRRLPPVKVTTKPAWR